MEYHPKTVDEIIQERNRILAIKRQMEAEYKKGNITPALYATSVALVDAKVDAYDWVLNLR